MLKLAVIGDPIAHSLSPKIHGAVFRQLGMECEYTAHQVKKGELNAWIDFVKREGIAGFNITMPHKLDIIGFLDEIDGDVPDAVNTVKVTNGKLKGYNTDGKGFCMSLSERGVSMSGKRVLIAGTGGASKVLTKAAAREHAESVMVLGRKDLVDIGKYAENTDIFINATPLGMTGKDADWEQLDFIGMFPSHCTVADLIYNPPKTTLLKKAEEHGLLAINGLGMLIYQAIYADEIFISQELDIIRLRQSISTLM